jgi:hypothetical protein
MGAQQETHLKTKPSANHNKHGIEKMHVVDPQTIFAPALLQTRQ